MASSYIGKPCPKCAYVRGEADAGPDWQCPKCGVAYAKVGQPAPAAMPAQPARGPARAEIATESESESPGLAKLAHLSSLANLVIPALGTIVAIGLWVTKSGEDELAVDSAKEALNFQISTVLWALGLLIPIFVFPPFAFVISVMLVGLLIACVVMPIVATVRVSDGTRYYYPYTLHIFGEGPGT